MAKRSEQQLQEKIKKWNARQNPITRRQAKQQLVMMGIEQQALDTINGISNPTEKRLLEIWFDDASVWERDNEQLKQFGAQMGLTEDEIDDFFVAAAEL